MKIALGLVSAGAVGLFLMNTASAESILVNGAPTITPVGTNFQWDYKIQVSEDAQVQDGDRFTIFDFDGYVGGSFQPALPAGWTLDASNPDAPDVTSLITVSSTDNPAITDLQLFYSGPTIGNSLSNTPLGTFSFISKYGTRTTGFLEGKDHTIDPNLTERNDFNTFVPVGVPVPAALWGGLGLLGALFTAKVSRRK